MKRPASFKRANTLQILTLEPQSNHRLGRLCCTRPSCAFQFLWRRGEFAQGGIGQDGRQMNVRLYELPGGDYAGTR